jgi:hypothetical protein
MVKSLQTLLHEFVSIRRSRNDIELEFRLGQRDQNAFHSGVPMSVFEQLEQDLTGSALANETTYNEIVDYFYTIAKGRQVRTRVHFDSSKMKLNTEHVAKESIGSFVVSVSGNPGDACRVEISSETQVSCVPMSTLVHGVRVKQRRVFTDVRKDLGEVWKYELCRTWYGNTRETVEYNQHHCEPVYEVECELVDADGKYQNRHTDEYIAESIKMKILVLLGYDVDTHLELSNEKRCKYRKPSE